MLGVLKTTLGFDDSLDRLTEFSIFSISSHAYDLLQRKATKQNQQREKVHGMKSGGNKAQASKCSFPVELHRTHSVPPAKS